MKVKISKKHISSIEVTNEISEKWTFWNRGWYRPFRIHILMDSGERYYINAPNKEERDKLYDEISSNKTDYYEFENNNAVMPTTDAYAEYKASMESNSPFEDGANILVILSYGSVAISLLGLIGWTISYAIYHAIF